MNPEHPTARFQLPPCINERARIIDRLIEAKIPHGAVRLYLALKKFADKNGACWPGRRRLKKMLHSDFTSIQRWVRILKNNAWLRTESYSPTEHPFVRDRSPSMRTGMIYWLLNGDPSNPRHYDRSLSAAIPTAPSAQEGKVGSPVVRKSGNETGITKLIKGTGSTNEPNKLSRLQKEIADRFEMVLGKYWPNDAGKWVNRVKEHCHCCERVVAEVENATKEQRIRTTPAQYAEQIWKEFSHSQNASKPRSVAD